MLCGLYFFTMNKIGILRVPLMEEIIGLDISEMGVENKELIDERFKKLDNVAILNNTDL